LKAERDSIWLGRAMVLVDERAGQGSAYAL